jgi:hypothetical protein
MGEQSAAGGQMILCPVHGTADLVRRVSAAYHEGTARTALRLGPGPLLKPYRRFLEGAVLLTMFVALFTAPMVQSLTGDSGESPQRKVAAVATVGAFILLPVAFLYGVALIRFLRGSRVRRGMARAMPVWRAGWYCGRCDGVFFAGPDRPASAPRDQLLPVEVFQQLVWTSGGYTDWGKPVLPTRA